MTTCCHGCHDERIYNKVNVVSFLVELCYLTNSDIIK